MELEFEVLRTGEFTDANGTPVSFDEQGLQQIADSYNPEQHEAPIVLGHPEGMPQSGDPAYGWIERLSRKGDRLIAHAKQILPEMLDLVRDGLYKKVSIGLNKDKTLHHVGLLGAQAPAVKGLAQIQLEENSEGVTVIAADACVVPDTPEPEQPQTTNVQQVEIAALREQIQKLQEKVDVLTTTPKIPETALLDKEAAAFLNFIDDAVNKGNLTPAQGKMYREFMAPLTKENLLTFAENPGGFFTLARKIVGSQGSRLRQPVSFTPIAPAGGSPLEDARALIAKNMQ